MTEPQRYVCIASTTKYMLATIGVANQQFQDPKLWRA